MSRPNNANLRRLLNLTIEMQAFADQGDLDRDDPTCGIIYGILRDTAYKLRQLVEEEMSLHMQLDKWD
jgi:hypothetical protein